MNDAKIPASVHRFRDYVALSVGKGETVYIHPDDALKLVEALSGAAADVKKAPFTKSYYTGVEYVFEGKV
jgi:hypothetical protein